MAQEHVERLGARIKERRDELGWTQGRVARDMPPSVEGNTISRWERGEHRPRDDYLEQLAVVLQTTVADLQGGPHSEKPEETPDLAQVFNGNGSGLEARLERIEDKLDAILMAVGGLPTEEEGRTQARLVRESDLEGSPPCPDTEERDGPGTDDPPPRTGGR